MKIVSAIGVSVAAAVMYVATTLYPGGFDWKKDFISTLLRGPAGPARTLAEVSAFIFCISLAFVFVRLGTVPEFGKYAKVIRIAGIGAMVYASLTTTVMHDLMVSVSLAFLLVAMVWLLRALWDRREMGFFFFGCVCLGVLVVSAAIYYSSQFVVLLPWGQRFSFSLLAVWVVAMDFGFPRAMAHQKPFAA